MSGFIERAQSTLQNFLSGADSGEKAVCTLRDLTSVLSDEDASIHAAQIGLHAELQQCLHAASEDVAALAADAIGATVEALPPGWGFPRGRRLGGELPAPPFTFPVGSWCRVDATLDSDFLDPWLGHQTASSEQRGALDGGSLVEVPDVFLRVVPSWVHRLSGQEHVGQLLWPSAVVLSRWLAVHRAVLRGGRSVLELGSGPGLVGLVAARCMDLDSRELSEDTCTRGSISDSEPGNPSHEGGARVVLTDFEPFVLRNLKYNARLNESGGSLRVAVQELDWEACRSPASVRYDIILGSDVVCCNKDAELLAGAIAALLRQPATPDDPGGVGIFCFPPPHIRFGVDHIAPALEREGLQCTHRRMRAEFCAGGSAAALAATVGRPGEEAPCLAQPPQFVPAATFAASNELTAAAVAGGHEDEIELWVVRFPVLSIGGISGE